MSNRGIFSHGSIALVYTSTFHPFLSPLGSACTGAALTLMSPSLLVVIFNLDPFFVLSLCRSGLMSWETKREAYDNVWEKGRLHLQRMASYVLIMIRRIIYIMKTIGRFVLLSGMKKHYIAYIYGCGNVDAMYSLILSWCCCMHIPLV